MTPLPTRRSVVLLLVAMATLTACQTRPDGDAAHAKTAPAPPPLFVTAADTTLPDSVLSPPDAATAERFDALMQFARDTSLHERPVGGIMQALGLRLRGAPYLEGTLDSRPEEALVVRLDGFDCVTFVEITLAMAQGVARHQYDYAGFVRRLAALRYLDGGPVDYCQRLHYFSEWIADNETRGNVRNLTADLGGRVLDDSLDFMTTHRDAYSRFATNDSLYACVQRIERRIGAAHQTTPLRYVPEDAIDAVADRLRAGDVVAFATSIDGLDVSHTGLVYVDERDDGTRSVGLLHASLSNGVVVSPDLQQYVRQIGHQIGIVIARPQEPSASSAPGATR